MAIKTFVSGEILTASDTNTYLNNAGLVYVTSQTIGSAVASVTVNNAFSSTYDSYRVLITNTVLSSGGGGLRLTLGTSTAGTSYYAAGTYTDIATAAVTGWRLNNGSHILWGTSTGTNAFSNAIDIYNPFNAARTNFGPTIGYMETGTIGHSLGFHNADLSYSAFIVWTGAGTMTGGTIAVYGYRKA